MTKVTLTDSYVLVETDDIDFSVLRVAVEYAAQELANTQCDDTVAKITHDT